MRLFATAWLSEPYGTALPHHGDCRALLEREGGGGGGENVIVRRTWSCSETAMYWLAMILSIKARYGSTAVSINTTVTTLVHAMGIESISDDLLTISSDCTISRFPTKNREKGNLWFHCMASQYTVSICCVHMHMYICTCRGASTNHQRELCDHYIVYSR